MTSPPHRRDDVPAWTSGSEEVVWRDAPVWRGRVCSVPDRLWRLPVEAAVADVVLPLWVDWSDPGASLHLA